MPLDQATINAIAAEVVRHLPTYAWAFLVVQAALTVLAAALGAFGSEYLKTRGKTLATKADFDELQRQLRANTEVVERIKAEVGQKDWAQREWTNLRRTKLEALLAATHDCEAYVERYRLKLIKGEPMDERDPARELSTIVRLYFPELITHVSDFSHAYSEEISAASDFAIELAASQQESHTQIYAKYRVGLEQRTKNMIDATARLQDSARELLVQIMGVEQRP